MSIRSKKVVETALGKKGFEVGQGDHHWFFYRTKDGMKTTVRTKTSHGSTKDLGDGLLGEMARQLKVGKPQFLELIDCTLSREDYEMLLVNSGCI